MKSLTNDGQMEKKSSIGEIVGKKAPFVAETKSPSDFDVGPDVPSSAGGGDHNEPNPLSSKRGGSSNFFGP